MFDNVFLILVGSLVGFLGTFFGIGGGIILVPILILVYNLPPNSAIATSLAVILFSSLAGILIQYKQKKINYIAGLILSAGAIPGAYFGSYFVNNIQSDNLKYYLFSIFLVIGIFMANGNIVNKLNNLNRKNYSISFLTSITIGLISTIAGIGGGLFQVPQMVYFLNFEIKNAIATSQLIILITSLTATITNLFYGKILYYFIFPIFIGSIFGSFYGNKINSKFDSIQLKKIFSILIFISAIVILVKSY